MSEEHNIEPQFEPEYPLNTVVAVFEEPEKAKEAVSSLDELSIDLDSVEVICNELAEKKFEELEEESTLKSKVAEFLYKAGQEKEQLQRYDRYLNEGKYVVQVPADDDQAEQVAQILKSNGGFYINHFSDYTVTQMDL
jgi:hypothetical protein